MVVGDRLSSESGGRVQSALGPCLVSWNGRSACEGSSKSEDDGRDCQSN